ncbi:MAG: DNA translocase FtsK [Syntrophomonadaceae bacterium]
MASKKIKKINNNPSINNSPSAADTGHAPLRAEIVSAILFMLAVFMLVALNNSEGIASDRQFIGVLGTYINIIMKALFGTVAVIAPLFLLAWSIHLGIIKKWWSIRMWGLVLLVLSILVYVSNFKIPLGLNPWEASLKGMGGGYLGGAFGYISWRLLGRLGTSVLLVLGALLAAVMILEKSPSEIAALIWSRLKRFKNDLSELMFYDPESTAAKAPIPGVSGEAIIINGDSRPLAVAEEPVTVSRPVPELPVKDLHVTKSRSASQLELVYRNKEEASVYVKPSIEMLTPVESDRSIDKKNIKDSIAVLEDTFASFGVSVKVNQVSCGPAVTRYELTPAPGVKISKIISLTDDLQLNLAAPGIRIEAPIPGKSAIGIEVPSSKVGSVGLRNILGSLSFKKLNSPLAIALGEDISGNPVVAKLSDMPHLLIAGSTGSGKSVCLNSIIISLLYNTTPDELKLVFIDPKMVELTVYNGIPHLMTPVVTDPKKAAVVLRWMTTEMEKRYKMFADLGVRDIYRYNQSAAPLPFIVIVIDELADLMMVAPVEVEDSICRLAQMARAAGMHLIVATQRPSVDVVTGIIKANIPSRIAFAVSSQTDSRTILDIGGAEKLLGKGDMLFSPVGAVKPYRVQGAYVSDRDIEATVNFIKSQTASGENVDQFHAIEMSLEQTDYEGGDELFWEAVRVIVENQKASVSFLQRKLRVGYARAARLMDIIEERGIVSEADPNKKREILIDEQQLEKLYANNKLC